MKTGYKALVGMVLRLVAAGMKSERAIESVSTAYACDEDSLTEWVANHLQ